MIAGFFLGRYATERDAMLKNRASRIGEESAGELVVKLSDAVDDFEKISAKLPPDLFDNSVTHHLVNIIECRNFTFPDMYNVSVAGHTKVMLSLHLKMLTNCLNNANLYIQRELFLKYN